LNGRLLGLGLNPAGPLLDVVRVGEGGHGGLLLDEVSQHTLIDLQVVLHILQRLRPDLELQLPDVGLQHQK